MTTDCDDDNLTKLRPLLSVDFRFAISPSEDSLCLVFNIENVKNFDIEKGAEDISKLLKDRFKKFTYAHIKDETVSFATANSISQQSEAPLNIKPKDDNYLETWGSSPAFVTTLNWLLEKVNEARKSGSVDETVELPNALTFLTRHLKKDGVIIVFGRYLMETHIPIETSKSSDPSEDEANIVKACSAPLRPSLSPAPPAPPSFTRKSDQTRPASATQAAPMSSATRQPKSVGSLTLPSKTSDSKTILSSKKAVAAPAPTSLESKGKSEKPKSISKNFIEVMIPLDKAHIFEDLRHESKLLSLKEVRVKYPWVGMFTKNSVANFKSLPYFANHFNKVGNCTVVQKQYINDELPPEERIAIRWEYWVAYYICYLNTSGKALRSRFLSSLPKEKAIAKIAESVSMHFNTVMVSFEPNPEFWGVEGPIGVMQVYDKMVKMLHERHDSISLVGNMINYMYYFFPPESPKDDSQVSQWSLLSEEFKQLLLDYTTLRVEILKLQKVGIYYSPNTELCHVECRPWGPQSKSTTYTAKFCDLPEVLDYFRTGNEEGSVGHIRQYEIQTSLFPIKKPDPPPIPPATPKKAKKPTSSHKKNKKRG